LHELALTPGVGQKIAETIFEYLQHQREGSELHATDAKGIDMQTGEIL
jgi:hypothetical protein